MNTYTFKGSVRKIECGVSVEQDNDAVYVLNDAIKIECNEADETLKQEIAKIVNKQLYKVSFKYSAIKGLTDEGFLALSSSKQTCELKEEHVFYCNDRIFRVLSIVANQRRECTVTFVDLKPEGNNPDEVKQILFITNVEVDYD